jgi:N,N-dimethylformamidase
MKVIGYSDELSAFPGDRVNFFVSCDTERYRADLVKLIHGDTNPDGPGFKIEPVPAVGQRRRPGRVQAVYAGSHVLVDDHPRLRFGAEFTLQVLVWPTMPTKPEGYWRPGAQGLVTKWDGSREAGYGLFIGEDGSLEAWLGDGQGNVRRTSSGKPLLAGCWYLAAMSVEGGNVTLYQEPIVTPANGRFALASSLESTTSVVTERARVTALVDNAVPLVMAGFVERLTDEPVGVVVAGHYNGKLDRPRAHTAALGREQMGMQIEQPHGPALVSAWNFEDEITRHGRPGGSPTFRRTGCTVAR